MFSTNSIKLYFKNTKTGDIKGVKVGVSWLLLIFCNFFGLPFFFLGVFTWGYVFLVFCSFSVLINITAEFLVLPVSFYILFWFLVLNITNFVLMVYMGIYGNELCAKYYLNNGYEFIEDENQDKELIAYAKAKWRIYE